jgi:phenylpropionate dioxygenase-like ring-hydroxylating dioxygenase large terminal subunit
VLHALEDRCPHRGAPLSQGVILGDRLSCPYHGVEVRHDGVVTRVPGSPGCKLEGSQATRHFHVQERAGAVFLYNSKEPVDIPPPLVLPEQLTDDDQYGSFLCYTEWKGDYRYVLDNVMDPMHGTYLHKQSHSMAEGDSAKFGIRRPTSASCSRRKASATSTSTGPSGPTPASTGCGWKFRTRRPAAPAATSSSSARSRPSRTA